MSLTMNSLFSDDGFWALDSNCVCQHGKEHFGFSQPTVGYWKWGLEKEASHLLKSFYASGIKSPLRGTQQSTINKITSLWKKQEKKKNKPVTLFCGLILVTVLKPQGTRNGNSMNNSETSFTQASILSILIPCNGVYILFQENRWN